MKLQDNLILERASKVLEEAVKKDYSPIQEGHAWGPTWSTAWFHVRGSVPEAWRHSKVALCMDTDSEALVWEAGSPMQGLDINRFDYLLRPETIQAGKFELFVEAAGNHLFGE